MNTEEIRSYANLMKDLGLTGMEVRNDEFSIRLEMSSAQAAAAPVLVADDVQSPAEPAENMRSLKAKFVGVFYTSPSESEEPYVKVGDRVKTGQTVCIIEAMKLINEIAIEEDGVITEICAKHGQLVGYGTELLRYRVCP